MACILKNIASGALRRYPRICKVKELEKHQTNFFSTKLSAEKEAEEEVLTDNKLQARSLAVEDYFQVGRLFTISDLFEARVHYGHKLGSMNDHMKPYIFGERLGHLIIDLDITARLLKQALNFTAHIAYRDGIILFVSQTPQHSFLIEKTAMECDQFAHTRRWRLGMLTNSTMMFGAMTRLPDLCIVLNTLTTVLEQHSVIDEAAKMAIPVVGVVDTNCNPNLITYPIPGNDDSPASIELYCNLFKTVILRAKEFRNRDFKKEVIIVT